MNRRAFLTRSALTLAAAQFPPCARAASGGAGLTLNGALALVPVSVGAEGPFAFLLDTGAAVCVLDSHTAVSAGRGVIALTVAGSTRSVLYRRVNLETVSAAIGQRVSGLLGANFFASSAATFDFAQGQMVLHPSGPRAAGSQDLVFQDIPYVRATVDLRGASVEGLFGLDTGLDTGVKLFRSALGGRDGGVVTTPGRTVTAGGSRVSALAPVETLRLAGQEISGLQADLAETAAPRSAPSGATGMIGAPAFVGRLLTLDCPGLWWSLAAPASKNQQ
jgi:hypothetical protein